MKYLIFITVVSLLLLGCRDSEPETLSEPVPEGIGLIEEDIQFPALTPEAREAVFDWSVFLELENDMKRINQGELKRFGGESERIVIAADSLMKNIPPSLNTRPITSRLLVLNTRVKLLHEVLHQRGSDSLVLLNNLEETNIAFSNLLHQINEKFEKARIDESTRLDQMEDDPSLQRQDERNRTPQNTPPNPLPRPNEPL